MTKPLIGLVSAPRSGTTQVLELLREVEHVESLGEWFDPRGAPYLQDGVRRKLCRLFGRDVSQRLDRELGRWNQEDPARSLRTLRGLLDDRAPAGVFKVFPEHLDLAILDRTVLALDGIVYLVLDRDPVDAFISMTKAKAANAWLNVDTTGRKVALDVDAFIAFRDQRVRFLAGVREHLARRGLPWADLSYEADVLPGSKYLNDRLLAVLSRLGVPLVPSFRRRLRLLHGARVDAVARGLRLPLPEYRIGLPRQDRSDRRADKVSNWDAFAAAVARRTGETPPG